MTVWRARFARHPNNPLLAAATGMLSPLLAAAAMLSLVLAAAAMLSLVGRRGWLDGYR